MRRQLLTTLVMAIGMLTNANAQGFNLLIETTAESHADRCIVAILNDAKDDVVFSDTLDLSQHAVQATLPVTKTCEGYLAFLSGTMGSMAQYLIFIPGDTLCVKNNGNKWEWSGSEAYRQAGEIRASINQLEDEYMQSLHHVEQEIDVPNANKDSLKAIAMQTYQQYRKDYIRTIYSYAQQHPDAEGTAMWLPYAMDKAAEIAQLMSDRVRNESRVSPILKRMAQEKAEEEARRKAIEANRSKIAEGVEAPDFTLKDIHGKDLTLSSLRGKYVVLDFWGSWCGWCIKGMPKMKEYYTKYKGKMEILGIDCNDTEEKWKKAVTEHELPWLHVYNPKQGTIPQTYAIQGFPTKFILSPDGKIAKIFVGESEDFYKYLDETLKN